MRWSLALLIACGSSSQTTTQDAAAVHGDGAVDANGLLALGALMPQAIAGDSHAVMTTPTVVAITYDNDPQRADVEAFFPEMAASPAWAAETAEYGIGALSVAAPIHLTGSAVPTDGAIRNLLTDNLGGASPAWGAPSESTLYSFTLPIDTTFTDDIGQSCCGGYHDDVMIGSADVAYALQCPCTGSFPPPTTALQALTFALSHELVEGVTDPRYEHDYAWGGVDDAHQVWAYATDGELADLCEFTDTTLWTDAPMMTYTISRIWSNAAAHAGTDPCVGAPTAPYYQTVPDQPDAVTISLFGGNVVTQGTKIPLQTTGTVTLRVAGAAGSGPFTITADDVATFFGASSPLLAFTQPTGTYALGDTIELQVTPRAADSNLGGSGAEAFEIATKPTTGGPTTYFYGLIGQ